MIIFNHFPYFPCLCGNNISGFSHLGLAFYAPYKKFFTHANNLTTKFGSVYSGGLTKRGDHKMNQKNKISLFFLAIALFTFGGIQVAEAQCSAKVDLGLAYVHLDNLTSGKTTHSADLAALRADVNFKLFKGLIVKPYVLYGASSPFRTNSDDSIFTTGLTVGHCFPICEKLIIQPNIGWTYTRSKTVFNQSFIEVIPPLGPVNVHFHGITQTFNSNGPSVGLDAYYSFTKCFRASISFQYIWSRTHAEVHNPFGPDPFNDKSDSKGASWSAMLEYDINDCWSVNVAGAYNNSLSKEKHGLRAAGAKLGLARWF